MSLINREALIAEYDRVHVGAPGGARKLMVDAPEVQPELSHTQKSCEYCHEDSDGYVKPIEKNCHAYVNRGFMGWHIVLKAKGWMGEAKINFCPMCGRELNR